eukprot:m.126520 g.126520  ORF g.126520 m.126520 type:complete len:59 (-) comp15774_c0_seq10:2946-3122(-)
MMQFYGWLDGDGADFSSKRCQGLFQPSAVVDLPSQSISTEVAEITVGLARLGSGFMIR